MRTHAPGRAFFVLATGRPTEEPDVTNTFEKPKAARLAFAKKAAARKAAATAPKLPDDLIVADEVARAEAALVADVGRHQHDRPHAHGARAPPGAVRLLPKAEVCAIVGVSYPTVWAWMRAGTFPRSRVVGGKSMWRSDEIDGWLAALPMRFLKGDQPEEVA